MRTMLSRDEIHVVLTTNIQEWKKYVDVAAVQDLNDELTFDDLSVVRSCAFYDDLHDLTLEIEEILDKHFMDTALSIYEREAFISIHNIYNN